MKETIQQRFSGPHWSNYIKRFSRGEVIRIDEKYNADGSLTKLWEELN